MTAKTICFDRPTQEQFQEKMFGSPDLGPLTQIPAQGPVNSRAAQVLRWSWRAAIAILSGMIILLAWLVANGGMYKPGDDIGYNLGLVGGLMMLSLLLYPLRKRIRFMDHFGSMKGWFRYHQVAGILGPSMVLFHSTFRIGAMNSRVALYAMLLVTLSGIVGRFIYRHIHRGMYGHHLTMRDAEDDLKKSAEDVRSVFAEYPHIEEQIKDFRTMAFASEGNLPTRLWRFLTLKSRGHRLSLSVRNQIKKVLVKAKHDNRLTRNQRILTYQLAKQKVDSYVDAICESSQLASWERLFSLWHVAHVPFLYLLVVSGIVHVVAVHMY
jgi:hypothetical protein